MISLLSESPEGFFSSLRSEALALQTKNNRVVDAQNTRDKQKGMLITSINNQILKRVPPGPLTDFLLTRISHEKKDVSLIEAMVAASFNVSQMHLQTKDVMVAPLKRFFPDPESEVRATVDRINEFLEPQTRLGFLYFSATNNANFSLRF